MAKRKIKTVDISKRRAKGSGSYGRYYRLSTTRGVKVLGDESGGWDRLKDVDFSEARRELRLLNRAKCRLVPKAFGVVGVYRKGDWYAGILMEHCEGTTLYQSRLSDASRDRWLERLEDEFFKLTGMTHGDLHESNVMYHKRKCKIIDFTPQYVG